MRRFDQIARSGCITFSPRASAPARRGGRVHRTPHLEAGCVRDCSCGEAGRNVAPARQDEAAPSACECESRSCPCWPRASSAPSGDFFLKKIFFKKIKKTLHLSRFSFLTDRSAFLHDSFSLAAIIARSRGLESRRRLER
jgi:hypothetical protein